MAKFLPAAECLGVAETFTTDLKESGHLLSQVLDVIGEPDFPIDSIFRLVSELEHVMAHGPDLVSHAYERVNALPIRREHP